MFFILCDNWKILLFLKVYRYTEIFNHYVAVYFEASVFREVRILCLISTITLPILKFQNKADYAS